MVKIYFALSQISKLYFYIATMDDLSMKKRPLSILRHVFSALAMSSVFMGSIAMSAEYKLDPSHSNARFYIDHFNTSTNHGGFYGINGDVTFDPEAQTGSADITIATHTLNTGDKDFDHHMSAPELLNSAEFPEIAFKSTNWAFDGEKPTAVTGDLTLLGQTHPVTLTATKFNCYDNPIFNVHVCGGDFTTTIDRSQWGLNFMVEQGMARDVRIDIQVEAIKQE